MVLNGKKQNLGQINNLNPYSGTERKKIRPRTPQLSSLLCQLTQSCLHFSKRAVSFSNSGKTFRAREVFFKSVTNFQGKLAQCIA